MIKSFFKNFRSSLLSLQSLAKYLLFLDANPSEYAKYHSWRSDFGVNVNYFRGPFHPMCSLCSLLHNEEKFKENRWHKQPHAQDKECDFKKWDFSHLKPINLSDE